MHHWPLDNRSSVVLSHMGGVVIYPSAALLLLVLPGRNHDSNES